MKLFSFQPGTFLITVVAFVMVKKDQELLSVRLNTTRSVDAKHKLKQPDYDCLLPSVSPDGKKMLFTSTRDAKNNGKEFSEFLYVSNLDGSGVSMIPPPADSVIYYGNGHLLKGNRQAVYTVKIGKATQLAISDIDGKNFQLLTASKENIVNIAVSPNGEHIVYAATRNKNRDIFRFDLKTKTEARLTTDSLTDDMPSFSGNGKQIAFTSNREGNFNIYVMDINGGNVKRITNNEAHYEAPALSPDGKKLAFTSRKGTEGSVQIMNIDGTNAVVVSTHLSRFAGIANGKPFWSPDSKTLFFDRLEENRHFRIYAIQSDGTNKHVIL